MIRNQTFRNEDVVIDGEVFLDCEFIDCRLIYRATEPVGFSQCGFVRCEWVFGGAAKNTLEFLGQFATGLGEGGQAMMRSIFEDLMSGAVDEDSRATYPPIPA